MEPTISQPATARRLADRPVLWIGALAAGLLALLWLAYRPAAPAQAQGTVISARALEEQYGLRVNLLAVTAGGGLVDLRLKVIDSAKAKLLLGDPQRYPALNIAGRPVTLTEPAEDKAQELNFDPNQILLFLFPNTANVVRSGTPVSVVFGDIRLEPTAAW